MMIGSSYFVGGSWGNRTEFTGFELECNSPSQIYHVGGCERKIPEIGSTLYARFVIRGGPAKYGSFRFIEVHAPGDPPDAFFGTVKLTHVGSMEGHTIKWEEYNSG